MKPQSNPQVNHIPEFKSLENLHVFMAAMHKGWNYSVEAPDIYGYKFVWLTDSRGEKVREFPVAYIKEPIISKIWKSQGNMFTELAELQFASDYVLSVTVYLIRMAGSNEDHEYYSYAYMFLMDHHDKLLIAKRELSNKLFERKEDSVD